MNQSMISNKERKEKVLRIFIAAKKLINTPECWLQGFLSESVKDGKRFTDNKIESAISTSAFKWCAEGAIVKAAHELSGLDNWGAMYDFMAPEMLRIQDSAMAQHDGRYLDQVNDQVGLIAVSNLIEDEINRLKRELEL